MTRPFARIASVAAATLLLSVAAACGSDDTSSDDTGSEAKERTLTVFAAASLKTTFTELAETFEAENEGVTVTFSFAGSSDLAAQINEGAPADVFASADERTMALVTDAGGAEGTPAPFATNTLQIATPTDNPAGVKQLADLADPDVKVVLCAPQVPCGAASVQLLEKAGVTVKPVSEEQSVTDVLGKVSSGEADAGLVYVTDVVSAGDTVHGVEVPEAAQVVNVYPITALAEAEEADLAARFVELVTGATGQAVLQKAGFGTP